MILDKRHLLAALATVAAAPVLAQSSSSSSAAPMGKAEADHAMRTAQAGHDSLMMANVGMEKARGAKVKEFAKFEHDEQTTIAEILKSMNPSMAMPEPERKAAEMLTKLKSASGAEFDKMFITGQIEGHQKLLDIQEDYLKVGKDRETIAVTKLARGMIKEHLALLEDLRKAGG